MKDNVLGKIIELETSIKLLEYLQRNGVINDEMHFFCINKLTHKLKLEKEK